MDTVSTKKLITVVSILAVLCAYTWSLRLRNVPQLQPPRLDAIPRAFDGFTATDGYLSPESLRLLGADQTLARSYRGPDGNTIDLFIGYFADQQQNTQIHSPKHCYPGAGWDIISDGSITLDLGGTISSARGLIISSGSSRQIVLYWFSMRGKTIPNEFALKWNQMTSALLAHPQAASFVRFSTMIPPGGDETARTELIEFVENISPHILEALMPGEPDDGS